MVVAWLSKDFSVWSRIDMRLLFPDVLAIDHSSKGNPIQQIGEKGLYRDGALAPFTRGNLKGFLFQPTASSDQVLIVPPKSKQLPDNYVRIVQGSIDPSAHDTDLSRVSGRETPSARFRRMP